MVGEDLPCRGDTRRKGRTTLTSVSAEAVGWKGSTTSQENNEDNDDNEDNEDFSMIRSWVRCFLYVQTESFRRALTGIAGTRGPTSDRGAGIAAGKDMARNESNEGVHKSM